MIIGYVQSGSDKVMSPFETRVHIFRNGKYISIPSDHSKWKASFLEKNGIEPVYRGSIPDHNTLTEIAKPAGVIRAESGQLEQRWEVCSRFETLEQWRRHLIRLAGQKCDEHRSAGIMFEGISVRTDAEGIALLSTLTYYNRRPRDFVSKGKTHRLKPKQLRAMKLAADEHVQQCFSNLSKLCDQIAASDSICEIDLDSGWPQ